MIHGSVRASLAALAGLIALSACGSATHPSVSHRTSATTATAAADPRPAQFPAARGRTLQQLAALVRSSAQFGAATATFTPGPNRIAFALNSSSGALIYAPTAVYVATAPNAPDVQGPYLAPADPLTVARRYQSKQYEGPGDISSIYETTVPLAHPGTYAVLTLSRTAHGLVGAPGELSVSASTPIPEVGQRPPAIATDTPASVHGDVALLTTRLPPESMHSASFGAVLGRRPIALLFSTPQLCTSRVCGPVTDIIVSLQHQFAGRITFIHEEVYADNQPAKGLRTQMKAFHLRTEPWLFTVNRAGRIAARLEGAFGIHAARQALEAALR